MYLDTVKPVSKAPQSNPRRRPPARADLPEIAATRPTRKAQLRKNTLAVNDDNFHWVPDNSIDLVLTDPPFNIAQDTNFHTYEKNTINSYRFDADKGWDSYTPSTFIDLLNDWALEFARVLRPGGSFAVFCADSYVSHLIDALETAGLNPRRTLTWRKPNAVPINRQTMMMSACEYIVVGVKGSKATFNSDLNLNSISETLPIEQVLVGDKAGNIVEAAVRTAVASVLATGDKRPAAVKKATSAALLSVVPLIEKRVAAMYVEDESGDTYMRGCVPNYVSFNSKAGNRLHPTEKPVPLLTYLLKLLSMPGDAVLDPFGGSGAHAEASALAGRSCIVVEQDPEFYKKITTRLKKL